MTHFFPRLRRVRPSGTIATMDASWPFVSVVLAVRNEAAHLPGCLKALARQTYPHDRFEVIVVDGCSTDDTPDLVNRHAGALPEVRLLTNPARLTPAAFNTGIAASRGEVVIILGARAMVAADFVAESVAALERTGADAVGGVVESRSWSEEGGPMQGAIARALRSPFGVGDARYRYTTREQEADTVNYGAYRREVFDRIGLFDESLSWVEDDELNYRLRAAGGRLVVSPRIRVAYYARPSLGALWRQQFRWGLNKPKVARRHPAQMRPRHAVPALFVASVALAALAAPVLRPARILLASILGAYALAALAATLRPARQDMAQLPRHQERQERQGERNRGIARRARRLGGSERARLPLAFATMHLAYGSGMLLGLVRLLAWTKGSPRRHGEHGEGERNGEGWRVP